MAISQNGNEDGGYWSSVTGQYYASYEAASAAEGAITNPTGSDAIAATSRGGVTAADKGSSAAAYVDPSSPSYMGPGYVLATDNMGNSVARKDPAKNVIQQQWELSKSSGGDGTGSGAPGDPNAPAADTVAQVRNMLPQAPKPTTTTLDRLQGAGSVPGQAAVTATFPTRGGRTTGSSTNTAVTNAVNVAPQTPGTDPNAPTGEPAPKVDTTASDKSITGVNNTISQLVALANTSPQTSAAEAQLEKSDQLAKLRAIGELRNNQDAALGAARSSRNRGDAGVLERQAVGESAYLGTKAQQEDVLRQAETEGNLAKLRADEEQTDFTNRANILSKAAELGMNVAALQIDVGKADLNATSNYINEQFQQLGIDKQVSAQEMGQILSFSQAMSAIKFDYDKMSNDDQQHTLDLMMQQYGIDANTSVALKQIAAGKKGTLEKVMDGVLGLVGAAAPVVASAVTAGAKAPTKAGP